MLGGISIARGSSRYNIEKKLQDLEEQKNKGYITLEEYDTLRIRYERKLGNKDNVSKLQEAKGFKPSKIAEKSVKRQELYDDFVDKYSLTEGKDFAEMAKSNILSKSTKRILVILFILIAFGVGIVAGISAINNTSNNSVENVTIADSAFSTNSTILNASNMSLNNNTNYTVTKKTYNKSNYKNYSKSYKSNSSSSSSSYSSSSSSQSNSNKQSNNNKVSGGSSSSSSSGYSSNSHSQYN